MSHHKIKATELNFQDLEGQNLLFWTPGLPDGVHGNRPCPLVRPSVSPSFRPSLNISETAH